MYVQRKLLAKPLFMVFSSCLILRSRFDLLPVSVFYGQKIRFLPLPFEPVIRVTSGQSYKHFTLVNYNSSDLLTRKLPLLQFYTHNLQV